MPIWMYFTKPVESPKDIPPSAIPVYSRHPPGANRRPRNDDDRWVVVALPRGQSLANLAVTKRIKAEMTISMAKDGAFFQHEFFTRVTFTSFSYQDNTHGPHSASVAFSYLDAETIQP
ncbi:hypothetical protein [Tropicimonas sp. IMCC6043]|uniref:hypothetical protein n=1 Tax=Tropicimonas sp. IMCC6043 TaxID=2510645 RepID=UPI00101DA3DE|nr:hypothetical protein [Tropicimonas sp. IMCC6043]RYH10591.1 hypothetical protein EU800_07545 [Tropicimonas sp. IMCC6043]